MGALQSGLCALVLLPEMMIDWHIADMQDDMGSGRQGARQSFRAGRSCPMAFTAAAHTALGEADGSSRGVMITFPLTAPVCA